jgi:hypothetical protein
MTVQCTGMFNAMNNVSTDLLTLPRDPANLDPATEVELQHPTNHGVLYSLSYDRGA